MAQSQEDDLFKHTSMTFGEHLEELRVSLFKAVVSLAIGFGIGLWFAPKIVQLIQSPLESALKEYYSQEAIDFVNSRLPESMRGSEVAQHLVLVEHLQPFEVFIAPDEVVRELRKKFPQALANIELPAEKTSISAGNPANPTSPAGKVADNKPSEPSTSDQGESTKKSSVGLEKAEKPVTREDLLRLFVWKPLEDDDRLKLESFNVQESFMIYIKAALLFGALIAGPFIFYFLWSFVAAGLYPHEKRYVHVFLPFSIALFFAGALLAFVFVFPPVLQFFFGITKSMGQGIRPRISEWLSFVLMLPLGFGVSFQLPLVMLFLQRINIFTVEMYLSKWRIAVLVMAIASMVLSPGGDPYSMMMMLVPLIGLYFGGIALCRWMPNGGRAAEPTRT